MNLPAFLRGITTTGHPYEPGGPWAIYASHIHSYMHRWILRTPWGTLRVHHILRADADPDPHDHPFDFTSLILLGGYVEAFRDAGRDVISYFRAGAVIRRKAFDAHRLVHVLPDTWTLVITGPKCKPWGYHTSKGWVPWRRYHGVTK